MSSTPVRIGIVGLGNIGQFHADRLREQRVDLVGGMDVDADARDRFAERYGTAAYADADALFADVDAVIVATPNRYHETYTIGALKAGLDVLLEKPMAHSLESAERIAEAARDADGFVMTGFKNRFANPVQVIKGFQGEGRFGDVRHVEANYVRRRGIPGRGSWFTDEAAAGGGSLIDIGVHAIDLALYFLDFPEVLEVSAITRSGFGAREDYTYLDMHGEDVGPEAFDVDDSATAFIRCADGKTVNLEAAWATNRPDDHEFLLRGTEAGACFEREQQRLTIYESDNAGVDHLSETQITTRSNDGHRAEQEAFIGAIERAQPPEMNTIEQSLAVQRVIDAIYRSSEADRAVRLDETVPETPVELD